MLDAAVGESTVVVGMFEGAGAGIWVVAGAVAGCATALAVGLIGPVACPLHAASDSRNGSIRLAQVNLSVGLARFCFAIVFPLYDEKVCILLLANNANQKVNRQGSSDNGLVDSNLIL